MLALDNSEGKECVVTLSAIAAVSANGVIGKDGEIPWEAEGEQALFKKHTLGKAVVMGRATWESIPEKFRPLPLRLNIVLTSRPEELKDSGCLTAASIPEAIGLVMGEKQYSEMVFAGGEGVYREAIPRCSKLYLTSMEGIFPGDAFFPEIDRGKWKVTKEEYFPLTEGVRKVAYTFRVLQRL